MEPKWSNLKKFQGNIQLNHTLYKTWNLIHKIRNWFLSRQNCGRFHWWIFILCFCCSNIQLGWSSNCSIWGSIHNNLEGNRWPKGQIQEGTKSLQQILKWKQLKDYYLIKLGFHNGKTLTWLQTLSCIQTFSTSSSYRTCTRYESKLNAKFCRRAKCDEVGWEKKRKLKNREIFHKFQSHYLIIF